MDIRFQIVGIAVVILLVIVFLSLKFLSRRGRYLLYGVILVTAVGVMVYTRTSLNPSTGYALELYAEGFDQPLQAVWRPDESGRFYVLEKKGRIRLLQDGQILDPPFLDIRDKVSADGSEQGLLSLAFHPDYQNNAVFYIYYSNLDNDMVLAQYRHLEGDPAVADPDSESILLTIPQINTHHNGGTILFGPDGYLYLGIGNGGDTNMNASSVSQDLSNYLGTIIRLDVTDPESPYQVPADNPYRDQADALPEIWAYGLRNPWRMTFDPATGDFYIADVGESAREEVNVLPAGTGMGSNFGWPWFEGLAQTETEGGEEIDSEQFVFPVVDYDHLALGGCSIIGGEVYYGQELPRLQGKYLYGDFCSGFLWALQFTPGAEATTETVLRDPTVRLAAIAVDGDGEVYLIDIGAGRLLKVVAE